MSRNSKRTAIGAAIAAGSVLVTLAMGNIAFFQLLDLKAQDAHFVLRGPKPTRDIIIIGRDDKALNNFPEMLSFWQPYYAEAMRAAAAGGAKTMVLDVAFAAPVTKYEPDADAVLAQAFGEVAPTMPVICAFVPASSNQEDPRFAVPLNMMASAFGLSAYANLTVDSDGFVRRQELLEAPKPGSPPESLARGMALRATEKFVGADAQLKDGRMFLAGREVPVDAERRLTINYAGPADTFPRVSLYDLIMAWRAKDTAKLKNWFSGKVVLLGPDSIDDRHATPYYTAFTLSKKWETAGVEVHANVIQTLLSGNFLKPVPEFARISALAISAILCVAAVTAFTAVSQTSLWAAIVLALMLTTTHVLFRAGWLLSTSQAALAYGWALVGGMIYRFATAEKKSSFLKGAVALFVGKQVAQSLDTTNKISLEGKRQKVTILFTDIRGFTAFCESKDPAVVVDLLNVYMSKMVAIIVKNGGHVNKFIGDGILAVFSDDDEGAQPGDHAIRTARCATEMVEQVIGDFRTGAGFHSGEVVIGNVGSSDKLEFTVLGNTVNLASRLESLNKDQHTRLLMSEESREMLGGVIDTIYLGAVPVKGKTEKMKLFTVTSLLDEERIRELRSVQQPEPVA